MFCGVLLPLVLQVTNWLPVFLVGGCIGCFIVCCSLGSAGNYLVTRVLVEGCVAFFEVFCSLGAVGNHLVTCISVVAVLVFVVFCSFGSVGNQLVTRA